MSVIIESVEKHSPADKAGVKSGYTLLSINGNEIMDVLDYRFYQSNQKLVLSLINEKGKVKKVKVKKGEYDELGLNFSTYLMDQKHSCKNKCIFCFIDQMPKGMRDSLYFKDDDSRLSFLFGNYITLTNITEHEVERIIKMHISPINISVHTTNPDLRVKMMNNKNAGKVLSIINRFNDAGIKINCQMVLCPGYNDGKELERTLEDLTNLENAECIAAVPVGLTKHRDGLLDLKPFDKKGARDTIEVINRFGEKCLEKYGSRRVYASDEFYIKAELPMPDADFYGDFLQLDNGVGIWSLLKQESDDAIKICDYKLQEKRKISLVTGKAAYPLITQIVDKMGKKWDNLEYKVYAIENDFFGHTVTCTGLLTGEDILKALQKYREEQGEFDEVVLAGNTMKEFEDVFLCGMTLGELKERLRFENIRINREGGYGFVEILSTEE